MQQIVQNVATQFIITNKSAKMEYSENSAIDELYNSEQLSHKKRQTNLCLATYIYKKVCEAEFQNTANHTVSRSELVLEFKTEESQHLQNTLCFKKHSHHQNAP